MEIKLVVKSENKDTTFTADLDPALKSVKTVADKVEGFLKETFSKDTFVRKDE